jgi:hypothetical protein
MPVPLALHSHKPVRDRPETINGNLEKEIGRKNPACNKSTAVKC